MTLSGPLFAGCGLFLDVGNPQAASDPAAHDAFVTVRIFNCLGATREGNGIPYPRESTTVTATAEGLLDGRRVSIPLRILKLKIPGLSAVFWKQPTEGTWLLNFRIAGVGPYSIGNLQTVTGALVAVRPNGVERRTQLVHMPATALEIDEALQEIRRTDYP
jgi:hypothetical protein